MDTAQQKSQALLEEKKKQEQQNGQDGFTDGKMLPSVTEKNPPAKVENPIPVIRKVRKMGLLDLVLPFGKEVSDKKVKTKELVSGRKLETGLAMEDSVKADGSMLSQVLYQQYLMEKLGNYIEPGKSGLSYQIEYIIGKKNSDEALCPPGGLVVLCDSIPEYFHLCPLVCCVIGGGTILRTLLQ